MNAERRRLLESRHAPRWWKWGPYVSERQWGTVREDYSADGNAWEYFPHEHARSRAYRWGEDGIAGVCDRHQTLCFALALWNGRDPILKERLFGLAGPEGNHGEDVKEYYFYLDSTPTHSYMKMLYKYPHAEFPYARLVEESRRRGRDDPEYELLDTGVFDEDRYFDVFVEYAKGAPDDLLVRVTAFNRGPDAAELHLLPTLWFRNTWSWGEVGPDAVPRLRAAEPAGSASVVETWSETLGTLQLYCAGDEEAGGPELLFTENETNRRRIFGEDWHGYAKDAFHDRVVGGDAGATSPERRGTKAAAWYRREVPARGSWQLKLRLTDIDPEAAHVPPAASASDLLGAAFNATFDERRAEADEFYEELAPEMISRDARRVQRQAFAGLLWSKQFYYYSVRDWLLGDPGQPPPPRSRVRNADWRHLYNRDIVSMPDKWEYPWYAAWDLAFHAIPLALVDPDFAKHQLLLLLREWYLHPNGQLPAYEWALGDVNPPVHAWACWRVFQIDRRISGHGDTAFLERCFHKLLLNFTWWVNRKDREGNNVFEGGFLGLDNVGVFDRSAELPTGGFIEQADGTSWMGMYCLNMLAIAIELALENPAYEDVASKFLEHFLYIAYAMNNLGSGALAEHGVALWDERDGFFYDALHLPDGTSRLLRVRSIVGLTPLFAVYTLEPSVIERLPGFRGRLEWFVDHRPDLSRSVASMEIPGRGERRLFALVGTESLRRVLTRMLDEEEFLSPYGLRSVSRYHKEHPFSIEVNGVEHRVEYEPAESRTGMFGGNSNWRGPVWFPLNYLMIESLQRFDHYYGSHFRVEFPKGSGRMLDLWDVSQELSRRLTRTFLRHDTERLGHMGRPVYGEREKFQADPHWRNLVLFYEYFDGDTGEGLGASHQTGWTGLVAKLIYQSGE